MMDSSIYQSKINNIIAAHLKSQSTKIKQLNMKNILNIAEKPSVARQISKILTKSPKLIHTLSQFNPVYQFSLPKINALMRFTSVTGHVLEMKFEKDLKNWNQYDPKTLFEEKVTMGIGFGNHKIVQNLEQYAEDAQQLILWLDCDLEGEAIAKQVQQLCVKFNPIIQVKRARFSSLSPKEIWYAINHLDVIRQSDVKAVRYRQELDFRVGCAITNIQTLFLKREKSELGKPINFGTCLIPLVSLIVDRFIQRVKFIPKISWKIELLYNEPSNRRKYWFSWAEDDHFVEKTNASNQAQNIKFGTVIKIQRDKIVRSRPLPLDTSTLLKHCTREFKLESLKVMEIAEKLYQQGFISYPRTETNKYPKDLDLLQIVKIFQEDERYKQMVAIVLKNENVSGRIGSGNDNAHAPIYPLQNKTTFTSLYEENIYDFIVMNFLASVANDVELEEHKVTIKANNGYSFQLKGIKAVQMGFLNILKTSTIKQQTLPNFLEGQSINISWAKVIECQTQPPPALTQPNLIGLMESNKIGTDSTIPQHISNIQMKGFAQKIQNEFQPTKLGLALIQSYRSINSSLVNPKIRAKMQENIRKISQNIQSSQEKYQQTLSEFIKGYDHLIQYKDEFIHTFGKFIDIQMVQKQEKQIQEISCHNCQNLLKLEKRSLVCNNCSLKYFLPKQGQIRLLKDGECFKCKSKLLEIQKGGTKYKICPRCFNYPQPHMTDSKEQGSLLPCFACKISECIHSGSYKIASCPSCSQGSIRIVKGKQGSSFIGCSNYPNCKLLIAFSSYVSKVQPSQTLCTSCSSDEVRVNKCKLTVGLQNKKVEVCVHPHCKVKRHYVRVDKV